VHANWALLQILAQSPFFNRAEALAKQRPDEEMRDPSEEILDIYKELRDAKRRYFMLGKNIELLRCKMKGFIGTHGGITGLATWKWKDHPGLDTPKFKEEQRELYEQYLTDRSRREFEDLQADLTKLCDDENSKGC
jgi:hypothetical protein